MTIKKLYFDAANALVLIYPDLNFKNHCYWRIALDNMLNAKWDTVIKKPAHAHLNDDQIQSVVSLLLAYQTDLTLLKAHNLKSLNFRKKKIT